MLTIIPDDEITYKAHVKEEPARYSIIISLSNGNLEALKEGRSVILFQDLPVSGPGVVTVRINSPIEYKSPFYLVQTSGSGTVGEQDG